MGNEFLEPASIREEAVMIRFFQVMLKIDLLDAESAARMRRVGIPKPWKKSR